MYELIQLTKNDYYIECPAKIGLVKINDADVILIDSGNDKDAGKKIYRIIEEKGWKLKAILNTHSHSDHIGGNKYLQDKTGCNIYAKGLECIYSNTPYLEPISLYGGLPFKDLKHKFLMAKESKVTQLTDDVLPEGMSTIELPGHSFDMVGFMTKEGTAFIADSVSSEETLNKYGIAYLWNPEDALQTLQKLKSLKASCFVPSHASVAENISELADFNAKAINGVKKRILELCKRPRTFEQLLAEIFNSYGLLMTVQQHALIGSTLRSYLSGMYEQKKIKYIIEGNLMYWLAEEEQKR